MIVVMVRVVVTSMIMSGVFIDRLGCCGFWSGGFFCHGGDYIVSFRFCAPILVCSGVRSIIAVYLNIQMKKGHHGLSTYRTRNSRSTSCVSRSNKPDG